MKDPTVRGGDYREDPRQKKRPAIFIAVLCALLFGLGLAAVRATDDDDGRITPPTLSNKSKPTEVTFAGASARCKDGTYQYRGGGGDTPRELCADHGGVEQEFK